MNTPLVSVILPTYRRGHVIGRALRSVLTQSYRNLEVIVLDDVPKDDTEAVVRSFNDSRVRYVAYPDRRGVSAARNQGFDLAQGKYIAFQDSDDEWLAEKLAYQVARMESLPEDVALTQAAALRFQGLGTQAEYYLSSLPEGEQHKAILACNWTSFTQAWLLRRSVLAEVGNFDERLPLWEDWELLIRICAKYRVDVDRRPVAVVYETPDGLTAQDRVRPGALELIIEKHRAAMERYPEILADNLYLLARLQVVDQGKVAAGRAIAFQSVRLDRRHAKAWVLAISALGGALPPRVIARLNQWLRARRDQWKARRLRRTEPV